MYKAPDFPEMPDEISHSNIIITDADTDDSTRIRQIALETNIDAWTAAMNAHVTQAASRDYVDLQLTRARLLCARAGVGYAIALYPNDPMVFQSLAQAGRGARQF